MAGGRVRSPTPDRLVWTLVLFGLLAVPPVFAIVKAKPPGRQGLHELRFISSHPLDVPEPSDLTIDEAGTSLWTVADGSGKVYELTLDGHVVRALPFVGEDLEGIAYDRSDRTLWVAEENRREIVHLNLDGEVLSRHTLGLQGEKNSGLEGLCLDDKGHMFALNEKRPGLFLELDGNTSIAVRREVTFARDYSGITYDRKKGCFWIVSDQSQSLYAWKPGAGVLKEYSLPFRKAEGVAVDDASKRVYIVSDSEKRLYVYRLED